MGSALSRSANRPAPRSRDMVPRGPSGRSTGRIVTCVSKMSSFIDQSLQRRRFHDASASPALAAHANGVLRLLLAQDGSTTRLCEAIAAGPVSLHVIEQQIVAAVPAEIDSILPGATFIERITCLAAQGEVFMDNLSYI